MRIVRSAFREVTADALAHDAPSVFQRLLHLPYPLFLDSSTHSAASPRRVSTDGMTSHPHAELARYSFAAAKPDMVIRASGRTVEIIDTSNGTIVRETGRALDVVRKIGYVQPRPSTAVHAGHAGPPLPFQGGWAGYIGYEYGGVLERIPAAGTEREKGVIPDVLLARYPWVIAWDHLDDRVWIVGTDDHTVQYAYDLVFAESGRHRESTSVMPSPSDSERESWTIDTAAFTSSLPRQRYEGAVSVIKRYISAGDVFQVNLSQQFSAPLPVHPWTLYQHLRAINPAPFSAYFDFGTGVLASVSPERFLKASASGTVETRPIKGTRPRGTDSQSDAVLREQLRRSAKDAAEHVMIVDVLRNDISRVSQFGSVAVPELMTLETHPTVHHLVSTVTGHLHADADAIDLLHASFPGGSITGAPKVRAMEIIAELEPVRRGIYCGAIGYLSHTGDMDTSIAIRTCVATPGRARESWTVTFSAGGGVVFDSDPGAEYDESIDKARALMRAIHLVGTTIPKRDEAR